MKWHRDIITRKHRRHVWAGLRKTQDDGVARDHFQSQSFAFMGCSTDTFSAIRALEINLNRHPGAYG